MVEKLVSIIMPAYNCVDYIAESIRSVQNQSYRNWELIVADDNSTDGTVDTVRSMAADDNRIHLLETDINLGPAAARNRAINSAQGNYIAFLDSDDIWFPDKLSRQISFMEQMGYDFTYTAYEKIDERGEHMGVVISAPKSVNYSSMLYQGDRIGNLTVVYITEQLGKFYVPDIKKRNDFALWLKIMHDCDRAYGLNEVLASYRVRSGSVSSAKKRELIKYHWALYCDIEKLSNIKSSVAIASLLLFKSVRQTDERIQKIRSNFRTKQTAKFASINIDKSYENTDGTISDSENITFERAKENDISATVANSSDAEYAQK